MVEILPFKGIRYNSKKIGNLKKVVAPPYDIISNEAKKRCYEKHECNVIRLILGKEFSSDNPKNNRYTRAASYFNSWLKDGILTQDSKPSIYVYEQKYFHKGKRKTLIGFIALVKLEEFDKGIILPHEETLSEPIEDRLKLMRTCKANFDQIFTLYSDPDKTIDQLLKIKMNYKPVLGIIDENGIMHSVWKISKIDVIKKVAEEMKSKILFIADGHHRYVTALKFRDEMRKKIRKYSGKELFNYRLAYLTNMDNKGITILPAHRLVRNIREFNISKLKSAIRQYFHLEKVKKKKMFEQMEKLNGLRHIFGMYYQHEFYLLTLKDEKILDEIIKADVSKEWKRLDVSILHAFVLEHIMGMKNYEDNIAYEIDEKKAIQLVNNEEYQLAFFLNPTKVEQVRDIALAREKMPGKATYFYPKLLTGLVMSKNYL